MSYIKPPSNQADVNWLTAQVYNIQPSNQADVQFGLSSDDITYSGPLVKLAQYVGFSASGTVFAIGQNIGLSRSGALLSVEQAIDLRLSGSGALLTFEQITQAQGQGQLLTVGQRIREPIVPSEVVRPYEIEVFIGGAYIEPCNLAGFINISREESSAALADITLQPTKGQQSLESYHGKSVFIQAVYPDKTVPMFSGKVDIPEFDIMGQRITLRCTDNRTERNNAQSRTFVQSIGRWDAAIFRDPENHNQEIEDRLTTTPMALDYDANGQSRLTAWQPKTTPDFVLGDADVYRREPRVEVASRGRIVNTIGVDFAYRYPRLRRQIERYSWSHPIAGGVCNWYFAGSPPLVLKSAAYSAIGLEWTPTQNEVRDIPPDGFYRCCRGIDPIGGGQSCGYVVLSTVTCTNTTVADTDGFGNQKTDANGNPATKTTQSCVGTGTRYAASVTTTKEKRYVQTVTENLPLQFSAPASISQFGEVKQELSYGFESDYNVEAWEDDKVRSPRLQAGNTDALTFNQYTNAMRTAQAVAKNKIVGSHRATTVSFQAEFKPEIGLHHTVEVDTRKIKSKGKAQRIRHVYDCTNKWADTEITTVHSRSILTVTDSNLSLPTRPNNAFTNRMISINIRYQRDRIEVEEPAVPDEDRTNTELSAAFQNYLVNIPSDPLEVFYDE